MSVRSFPGLGFVLLLVASCVPPAGARFRAVYSAVASVSPQVEVIKAPPSAEILAEAIAPGAAAKPFDLGSTSRTDVLGALDCLTAAIYYEARSESVDGQRAVAQVVLNRVRHPAFPKSVCGVVYQGSGRSSGCQFTFTCDGSLARARRPGPWERARKVAAAALAGYVYGPVGLATHYHTIAIHPWWADSMSRAVTIGAHIFYRWRGEWGDPKAFRRPYVGGEVMVAATDDAAARTRERIETIAGVTIHRSDDRATGYVLTEDGTRVREHRMGSSFAGVTVHRGEGAAQTAQAPVQESAAGESDPVPVR